MRKTVFTAALAAVALATVALVLGPAAVAVAQQSTSYAGSAQLGGYRWQGPYAGVNLGYQMGSVSNNPTNPSGIFGGAQAGYNWQYGSFVFGGETDLQLSAADDLFAPWKFSNPWFGTTRARAGVALNNVLLYGTIGLAYGTLQAQSTVTGVSESKTLAGWAGGAGLEVALMGNWSAKAEYLYVDLGSRTYSLIGTGHGLQSNLLRFGVNYRF
jgi:outer membrane immunogenic protein